MTIFVDAQTLSNLTTYTGLVASVGRWLNRPDLADDVPDFIRLAEARFRRELVMPDMETTIAVTPASSVALPVDFDSVRALGITGRRAMDQLAPADYSALPVERFGAPVTGEPDRFAIIAGQLLFWPPPDASYSVRMAYLAMLPPLGLAVESNWLLAKHPDAYLYATLLQAEFYGWNDDRLSLMKGALDEVLDEIKRSGARARYGAGPLVMKPPTQESLPR